jgi:type II secretory ATPase GspE/PulE/Tfp pilus assembly ATPase PilB-like protein
LEKTEEEIEVNAILELFDRGSLEVEFTLPFRPDDEEVNVLIKGSSDMQKFVFSEISCILMKSDQTGIFGNCQNTILEEVITSSGKTYQVYMPEEQPLTTGIFGLSAQKDMLFPFIFFPKTSIKARVQNRALGEILQSEGILSTELIQSALKEQQRLKKRLTGEIISEYTNLSRSVVEDTFEKGKVSEKISRGTKIGEILVASALITREQLNEVLTIKVKEKKKKIGELLVELGYLSEENLLKALGAKFQIKMLDLSSFVPHTKALESLSYDVVCRLNVFPIVDKGDRLIVATSEPLYYNIEDDLRFYTGRKIETVLATSNQIKALISKYYPEMEIGVEDIIGDLSIDHEVEIEEEEEEVGFSESDSKVVKFVNKILIDAYNKGASDIHFEPGLQDQPSRIRYRIDGACQVMSEIPTLFKKAIISRLKIMANLDITERRKPQSGKVFLKFQAKRVEYRLEITPLTSNNEAAVLRILAASKPLPIEQMGFSDSNLKAFRDILSQPFGIILCVGPTGSGKTTTLHSALGYLNTPDRKIWTAEDPVEITQAGLQQVQINSKIGVTFSEVLRSFLRADPDVIMIGEMRDAETAKTAIEASLTGHLVLSTLHTNSAPETIVRLIEMGMDPFNFSDAMLGVLAQRLCRRLCNQCKKPYHPNEEEFSELVHLYNSELFKKHKMKPYSQEMKLMRKGGCENCNGTGYRGRMPIHELVTGTENLKKAIKEGAPVNELKDIAIQEGTRTLLMDGIQKIFQGLTDLHQILKVCSSRTISD